MTGRSLAYAAISAASVVALVWWIFWALHFLKGWAAMPLGLTVGAVLYGLAFCFGFASVGARRK